jgi:nickel/cobalt exporter
MPDLSTLILNGAVNPWFYLPVAVILGALHALEPGHSKSLMAAFIVAIRGTVPQAILLGISAAVGHTIIVWGLAVVGFYLGDRLILDRVEPWLEFVSCVLIVLLALRLFLSARGSIARHENHGDHPHGHDHGHDHGHAHPSGQSEDAHAAAHARDIQQRFAGRKGITALEIAWFGFTGGLLPCPAAIAVLLVCLQLKAFTLGIAMVGAFSLGLAITLVTVGMVAAWGTRQAPLRWRGFDAWASRLPYISGVIVMAMGLFIAIPGLIATGLLNQA